MYGAKIESIFVHNGLTCTVLFQSTGHRCGYVAVEKGHPLFGINYNQDIKSPELLQELKNTIIGKRGIMDIFCWDGEKTNLSILIDVHGSLTYSGGESLYPILTVSQISPRWWFGFDCAHCDDSKDWESVRKYFPEHQWRTLWEIDQEYPTRDAVRTQEYVESECRNLADSLICIGELLKETRILIT